MLLRSEGSSLCGRETRDKRKPDTESDVSPEVARRARVVCVREAPREKSRASRLHWRRLLGLKCTLTLESLMSTRRPTATWSSPRPQERPVPCSRQHPSHSGVSPTGHCHGLQDWARLAPQEEEVLHKKPSENSGEKEKECAVRSPLEEQVQPASLLHASPGDRPAWPRGWPCAREGLPFCKRKSGLGGRQVNPSLHLSSCDEGGSRLNDKEARVGSFFHPKNNLWGNHE